MQYKHKIQCGVVAKSGNTQERGYEFESHWPQRHKKIQNVGFFLEGGLPCDQPWNTANIETLPYACMVTHGKTCRQAVHHFFLPCAHNLAVSKSKVHRRRVCRVFFAVSNTRQSLRCVRYGLCRVHQAHGEPPLSGSDRCEYAVVCECFHL